MIPTIENKLITVIEYFLISSKPLIIERGLFLIKRYVKTHQCLMEII